MTGSSSLYELRAVIFDWAGTLVDFGSRAPAAAFVEAFARFQITATENEAREPMGLPKRAHIAAMLAQPRLATLWEETRGTKPDDDATDAVYEVFVPINATIAKREADLIPGTLAAIDLLRKQDVKIGSTTGYVRPIMEGVVERAAAQGFSPDCAICADEVPVGRPTAMAMYYCFVALGIHEPWRVVKVDDTAPGIAEGRAAGTWTIGLSLSGNAVGLTEQALNALSEPEKQQHRERAGSLLSEAGADYVIDSIADIQEPLEAIGARIAAGQKPPIY